MQTCGICNTQAPDISRICAKCGADLTVESTAAQARRKLQTNDRVSLIRVSVAHDACPVCAAGQGAYPKAAVPVLPHEGCSHGEGCRCYYEPVLTEIYP
ncbi:MAG: hypothetical protein IT317_02675 [Anaerolineales bacterium]|nr:hypothetical protein [Anaerolineales bacterium]